MSRSEETQPAVLFSLSVVCWEGDPVPTAEEIQQAIWRGLSTEQFPAAVYVEAAPFNPTEGGNDA